MATANLAMSIRPAAESEYESLGKLMVAAYSSLEGFPKPDQMPGYYEMLANIGRMAQKPETQLLVAVRGNELLGGVVYFSDMAQYGSGGTATGETNASGFRLLAVDPGARGMGVGKRLVGHCLELARAKGHGQMILHTTKAMQVAWRMYEGLGFQRSTDLDFSQGELGVFGFRKLL
jgi:GNAT superfamily N-acetyltransferase